MWMAEDRAMIELRSPLQIEPSPQGGWQLVLWTGEAFDYETPFRAMLATIAEALGRECHLHLPAYEKGEDFVEGNLQLGAIQLQVYYEHSLSYLAFVSDIKAALSNVWYLAQRLEMYDLMANDLEKANYWREFILSRCRYPAIDKLRVQFANATFQDFCQCGCNSFAVAHPADSLPQPIAMPGGGGAVFEVDFYLSDERTLEFVLFVDKTGRLNFVEVDCCGNGIPVPDLIEVDSEPFRVHASKALLTQ